MVCIAGLDVNTADALLPNLAVIVIGNTVKFIEDNVGTPIVAGTEALTLPPVCKLEGVALRLQSVAFTGLLGTTVVLLS